ncbi:MAG: ligand-binding SRPBCC domain-containing protein [Cyclobacteriaceae bacterium]|jgi:ligand-binding SRPBCC domain-containing protein
MHLMITTKVEMDMDRVRDGFTKELFLALNPPFPKVDLLEFGGCRKGDKVSIMLKFPFFSQIWISEIYDDLSSNKAWYFADRGVKLPFFLSKWDHSHIVRRVKDGSEIVDDITFSSGMILFDILLYPVLLGQFIYRKPIYKKWFKKEKQLV